MDGPARLRKEIVATRRPDAACHGFERVHARPKPLSSDWIKPLTKLKMSWKKLWKLEKRLLRSGNMGSFLR